MDRPNQRLVQLPVPNSPCGKSFADKCARLIETKCVHCTPVLCARCVQLKNLIEDTYLNPLETPQKVVLESPVENDGFSEDLDPNYLKFLGRSFSSEPDGDDVTPTVMSVVTIDTATHVPNAPKPDRNRREQDLDISLPADLFETSANDSGEKPMTPLRAAIEERRQIQLAAELSYSESTPQGRHIRQFRHQFPPKP